MSSPRLNPESLFGFCLRYSAGAYWQRSQHFKASLPVIVESLLVYRKAVKAKLNHISKLWLYSKLLHTMQGLPWFLLCKPASFTTDHFEIDAVSPFTRPMKLYRFENGPLLKPFSKRPGSGNKLDRCHVNERHNSIKTDVVTNETASMWTVAKSSFWRQPCFIFLSWVINLSTFEEIWDFASDC